MGSPQGADAGKDMMADLMRSGAMQTGNSPMQQQQLAYGQQQTAQFGSPMPQQPQYGQQAEFAGGLNTVNNDMMADLMRSGAVPTGNSPMQTQQPAYGQQQP